MTRMLSRAGIILALLAPCFALAAYNDVTLDTTVVLNVNSIEVDVTGSTASIASITINPTNFTIDLEPSSTITLTAPNRNILSPVVSAPITATETCTDSTSSLVLTSSSLTTTVTIRPGSTLCTTPSSSGGGGGGGGGGVPSIIGVTNAGGGGGGGGSPTPVVITPTTPSAPVSTAAFAKVTLALKKGSVSGQVKVLQQMLNQDKDTRVSLSGAGSPGKETTLFGAATLVAIKKFQVKWGIAKPGDDGYGNLGPKTRAKLNALFGK